MSLLVRLLTTGKTLCVSPAEGRLRVGQLKAKVSAAEGVPCGVLRLWCGSRLLLRDGEVLRELGSLPPIIVRARLPGGKGGFGSLMRAYAAKLAARSRRGQENQGAMRDLWGRRIRHVEAAKQIKEWQAQEHKVDHKEMQQAFRDIRRGRRSGLDRAKCKFGVDCKYKWKCRFAHPDDEERRASRKRVSSIKEGFGTETEPIHDGHSRESIISAIRKGLQKKNRKRTAPHDSDRGGGAEGSGAASPAARLGKRRRAGGRVDDTAGVTAVQESIPTATAPQTGNAPDAEPENGAAVPTACAVPPRDPVQNLCPAIDLDKYSSASELEPLGLNHLKAELKRLGLKCGGTLQERAERLFHLKTTSIDALPANLRARQT